jgi:hypothetical protein
MKSFRDALHISRNEKGARLQLAVELLLIRNECVVLEDTVGVCPDRGGLSCEVITRHHDAKTAAGVYEREFVLARHMYETSTLAAALKDQVLRWSVVDDYGMGRAQVWRAA